MFKVNRVCVCLASLIIGGCLGIPHPPGQNVILSSLSIDHGVELYELNHRAQLSDEEQRHGVSAPRLGRNLIFVALDESIQKKFKHQLDGIFPHSPNEAPPRIEEVVWWMLAPKLTRLYDSVIRISYDAFSKDTLFKAIKHFEVRNMSYDLILLTHGFPNHLATSVGYKFLSWEMLGELKGKLKNLGLVYMSSCFSSTLVPDWTAAGAREVISFKKYNSNYFYPFLLVENLNASDFNTVWAYEITNHSIKNKLHRRLYRMVIEGMLFEGAFEKYLETLDMPEFYEK